MLKSQTVYGYVRGHYLSDFEELAPRYWPKKSLRHDDGAWIKALEKQREPYERLAKLTLIVDYLK